MVNRGIFPPDPTTPVGKLRLLVGDTDGEPISGDPGYADYAVWSDDALSVALTLQDGNVLRAAGMLYLQLAAEAAQIGGSIKTDDLNVTINGRGDTLLKIANSFLDEATAEDNAKANNFFQVVPFGGRAGRCRVRPEGTPRPLI